jgi:STE24 endopeptidase
MEFHRSIGPPARTYSRVTLILSLLDLLLGRGFLVVLLATGWHESLRDVGDRIAGGHYFYRLFLYVLLLELIGKLLTIGVDFCSFRLEHHYGLSVQSMGSWAADAVKTWLIRLVIVGMLAGIIYESIRISPSYWWIMVWLCFVLSYIFFSQIAPFALFPLFYKFVPLRNEDLNGRLLRLSERAGTKVGGVYEWKLSEKSNKANAALVGLGSTRRILLADTLLKKHDADEIEAVLAHELGHQVYGHIFKNIVMQAILALAGFWAANWVLVYATQRRHMFVRLDDFANLPLLVLVATVFSLLRAPISNGFSRFHERQADRYCWSCLPSVTPFITSMKKMNSQNLGEETPSRIMEILIHDHPSVSRRIAAAQIWEHNRTPNGGWGS